MQELFLKYGIHALIGIAVSALAGIFKFVWNQVRLLEKHTTILEEQTRLLRLIAGDQKSIHDRLDVQDQLHSNIYAKNISSKMISEGRQTYPVFHSKKLREDH